jgi:multicomponent Na+:H+ antiporter subunit C
VTAFPGFLPYALAAWLLVVGLWGVVRSRNLIHMIICLQVIQAATYIVILAVGYRSGAAAPIFYDIPKKTPTTDPVVGALTLTDVVVESTLTAVLLAFAVQAKQRFGTLDPRELAQLKG